MRLLSGIVALGLIDKLASRGRVRIRAENAIHAMDAAQRLELCLTQLLINALRSPG